MSKFCVVCRKDKPDEEVQAVIVGSGRVHNKCDDCIEILKSKGCKVKIKKRDGRSQ